MTESAPKAPIIESIPPISPEIAERYRGLLHEAYYRAGEYMGTEVEDFLEPLLAIENLITEQTGRKLSHGLEMEFASAAQVADPETAPVNAVLGFASASFRQRLSEHEISVATMLDFLRDAGAQIIDDDNAADFITTEPRALPEQRSGATPYRVRVQPRLSWLVQGLRSMGIFPEDLRIHMRNPDARKMKKKPHILIEIPRLGKQIMLNQRVGEVTFVAQELYEFSMWEKLTKYQLKTLSGVSPVILRDRDRWMDHILSLLQEGNKGPGKKVDLTKKETISRKSMPISVALILQSIQETHAETGAYPAVHSGLILHGKLANGKRTWVTVDIAMRDIWNDKKNHALRNGLTRENCPYSSLAALKDAHGYNDHYSVSDIIDSLQATHAATGEYPSVRFGLISYGKLANGKRTWVSVDLAMADIWDDKNNGMSFSGLTRENCPYSSLAALKDAHEFKRVRVASSPICPRP